jgi:hypothetical protein
MAYTTINKSTDYFNTKLYTGNQSSTHAVTGVGFEPSLTWLKNRSGGGSHYLYDATRAVTKSISSDTSSAELTNSYFSSFNTDGFTLGSASNNVNGAYNYVAWNWKANGAGSANTAGSINSTVSANTTAGFSIVKWTGTGSAGTIGHGLGSAPLIVLFKSISGSSNWYFYTYQIDGSSDELALNLTEGKTDRSLTAPTSSLFYVDGQSERNGSGATQLAYCFAEKQGYSKFGSYTGNGNANGTFVYTGFKPAFVIYKRSSGTGDWVMATDSILGYNQVDTQLLTNTSSSETTNTAQSCDILSNGFKLRGTQNNSNASGSTYIYMAFGQSLVGSNNVPCTAR